MDSGAQTEAGLECMSCVEGPQGLAEGAQRGTHSVPIEDVGQLVSSQLHIRPQLGSRPAHSHLTRGDCLELEVPAATLHRVGFLCPEDAHSVPTRLALHQTYRWGQAESEAGWGVDPKALRGWWETPEKVRALAGWGKRDKFLVLQEKNWRISD